MHNINYIHLQFENEGQVQAFYLEYVSPTYITTLLEMS